MTITDITAALNAYDGDNIWADIIWQLGPDEAATEALDPSGASDVFVVAGQVIRHLEGLGWRHVGPYVPDSE